MCRAVKNGYYFRTGHLKELSVRQFNGLKFAYIMSVKRGYCVRTGQLRLVIVYVNVS